jgi:hypothetical protein
MAFVDIVRDAVLSNEKSRADALACENMRHSQSK